METSTEARRIAEAASLFQKLSTDHSPNTVGVVLEDDTPLNTLHGPLAPAEMILVRSQVRVGQFQYYHRRPIAASAESLRLEIKETPGGEIRETAAKIGPVIGSIVPVFTTETIVQMFPMGESGQEETKSATNSPTWDAPKPEAENPAATDAVGFRLYGTKDWFQRKVFPSESSSSGAGIIREKDRKGPVVWSLLSPRWEVESNSFGKWNEFSNSYSPSRKPKNTNDILKFFQHFQTEHKGNGIMYTHSSMRAAAMHSGGNEQAIRHVRETIPEESENIAPVVTVDEIRSRAFRLWENAGKPEGDGVRFWLEAEKDLVRNNKF